MGYVSVSSSSSKASTPAPSPPLPLPPPATLPEGLSQGPLPTMEVHGKPSKEFPVVNLDSEDEDEDWDVPDTSRGEEITSKLFCDLNCDLLGPFDDDKVIVVNDSDEE
jgi:hypothetical protein